MDTRDFGILYEMSAMGTEGKMLWRSIGDVERTDVFVKPQRGGDIRIGDSYLEINGQPSGGCSWDLGPEPQVELDCALGPLVVDTPTLLFAAFGSLEVHMAYVDSRKHLGIDVFCYRAALMPRNAGEMCLSEDGLPLSVDVVWDLDGPMTLRAVEVLDPADISVDVERLPWDTTSQGAPPEFVCLGDLVLPPIGEISAYVRSLPASEALC
jgi:hypothetical protein